MWKLFQPGEGPSRGLLRDCEIFGNIRITFILSTSERDSDCVGEGGLVIYTTIKNE